MYRWLKNDDGLIAEPGMKRFAVEQLRVFSSLPAGEINTRIHETFVPAASPVAIPASKGEWQTVSDRWMVPASRPCLQQLARAFARQISRANRFRSVTRRHPGPDRRVPAGWEWSSKTARLLDLEIRFEAAPAP
jgi:hypothetical protein